MTKEQFINDHPNIKINIFPSDSTLEYEFQKETGFKYREFHKETL